MSDYTINVWLQTINTKFVALNQFINQLLTICLMMYSSHEAGLVQYG